MLHTPRVARNRLLATLSAAFLCVVLTLLPGTAAAAEVIYKVKWKDREFHLVGAQPFRPKGADMNWDLFNVVQASSGLYLEQNIQSFEHLAENVGRVQKAVGLMPAKDMPPELKKKFAEAVNQANQKMTEQSQNSTDLKPMVFSPEFFLTHHLLDAALAVQSAAAPFPADRRPIATDGAAFLATLRNKRPVQPLLNATEFYESYSVIPRADMEAFISLASDAVLDPEKGAAWKAAYARCHTALHTELPTPAHNACVRDLHQQLKIPLGWLQGQYDRRNPLLLERILTAVEAKDGLVISLHHLHLGGPSGLLAMLRQRGATYQRVHGGPPQK